jgi:hypothetical protein
VTNEITSRYTVIKTDLNSLEEVIIRGKTTDKEEGVDSLTQNIYLLFDGFKNLRIENANHE